MRLALLLVLVACDEKKAVDDYLVRSATKSIAELKQVLATPADKQSLDWGMVTRCADMANIAEIEKLKKPLADELRQLCTKDVPLAMMTAETAKAEAAPKNKDFNVECHSPTYSFAKEKMVEAGTIDLAKDVIARHDAACATAP